MHEWNFNDVTNGKINTNQISSECSDYFDLILHSEAKIMNGYLNCNNSGS